MGAHWAAEGTVVHRMHHLTRTRQFLGPGFQIAQEVGEAAQGGQVGLGPPSQPASWPGAD
jgi:hypothetical protein